VIGGAADLATGPITRSAVRVQGPAGRPGSDDPVLRWWRSGRRGPVPAPAAGWLALVRAECAAGVQLSRIVVLAQEAADHQDLLVRWWLPQLVAAGEQVWVLDPEDHRIPGGQEDFWLVDGIRVIHLDHDRSGGLAAATTTGAAGTVLARRRLDRLRALAESFDDWRARTGTGRVRGLFGPATDLDLSA
jgi:hypothetical protein